MPKEKFLALVAELYRAMNTADSDNPDRADWMNPQMAGEDGCALLDELLRRNFTPDELRHFHDS